MAEPPKTERPTGQRFSHAYLDRGAPTDDSPRMRRRIGSLIRKFRALDEGLGGEIEAEHGIDVPSPPYWDDFLERVPLQDVLDAVTTAFRLLRKLQLVTQSQHWLGEIQRIFQEENVHYGVDKNGGVHLRPDADYVGNRSAAIAALQSSRYANALHAYETGTAALIEAPQNGKGAIRGVFAAVEAIFCLLLPNMQRLGADECRHLEPLIQRLYTGKPLAAALKMLNSLKDWVDAAQFYRHEEGKPDEVVQPPLDLAIYIVSGGAPHLRWLAQLDAALRADKPA